MKTLKIASFIIFVLTSILSGTTNASEPVVSENGKTKVYYFHNTRRCMTCNAIEKVAKTTLEKSFSEEIKKGDVVFETYNAEEKKNKDLCKKLGVTGSALIVVKGEEVTDLTSKGFMYAANQPKKLEKALVNAIK